MSIVSMADNKVVVEKRKADNVPLQGPAALGTPEAKGVPANVLNQLMLFIPTEIITLWVAYLAIVDQPKPPTGAKLCQADFSNRWIAVAVFGAVAISLTAGLCYRKAKDVDQSFKWPIFEMLAAAAAFVAWVIALPETPLASACWYDENAGSFVVLVATIAITTVGYILGKTARFEKA